ncbi:MAG: zinc-binding dehydrogenase [Planctomycetota bacterium]
MKAVVLTGYRKIKLQDVPAPKIEDTPETPAEQATMLLKVEAASICNASDYRLYVAKDPAKVWPYQNWPFVLGHELCGTVVETGPKIKGWNAGDRIVGWCPPYGGFAEYCRVYGNFMVSIHVPQSWPAWQTCVLEMAIATCRKLVAADGHKNIEDRSRVIVVGLGASGQFYTQMAGLMGASHIIGIDMVQQRRDLASKLGADEVFAPDTSVYDMILKKFGQVDVVIDTTGLDLRSEFYKVLRKGGMIIPFGIGFDWTKVADELEERNIRIAQGEREEAIAATRLIYEWINNKNLKIEPLITHRIRLEDIPGIIPEITKKPEKYMKVVAEID